MVAAVGMVDAVGMVAAAGMVAGVLQAVFLVLEPLRQERMTSMLTQCARAHSNPCGV
jgi:hypothetical protein